VSTVYFEDLAEGAEYCSPEAVADRAEMLEYARRNDPWPVHVDEHAARQSSFGGLIASGGYTLSLAYRLGHAIYNTPGMPWAFVAGFDWRARFPRPLRPGDRVRLRMTIRRKHPSSVPGRGIVTIDSALVNQDGASVYENTARFVMDRRPPP
jgi:acyl dehydratase